MVAASVKKQKFVLGNSPSLRLVQKKNIARQGKCCNNLAARVIPFFIVSKSSVGKTILKTFLPHYSKDPVA